MTHQGPHEVGRTLGLAERVGPVGWLCQRLFQALLGAREATFYRPSFLVFGMWQLGRKNAGSSGTVGPRESRICWFFQRSLKTRRITPIGGMGWDVVSAHVCRTGAFPGTLDLARCHVLAPFGVVLERPRRRLSSQSARGGSTEPQCLTSAPSRLPVHPSATIAHGSTCQRMWSGITPRPLESHWTTHPAPHRNPHGPAYLTSGPLTASVSHQMGNVKSFQGRWQCRPIPEFPFVSRPARNTILSVGRVWSYSHIFGHGMSSSWGIAAKWREI